MGELTVTPIVKPYRTFPLNIESIHTRAPLKGHGAKSRESLQYPVGGGLGIVAVSSQPPAIRSSNELAGGFKGGLSQGSKRAGSGNKKR